MRTTFIAISLLLSLSSVVFAGELTCPKGTKPNGEQTPDVDEAWCEILVDGGMVEHGPYKAWWPNGKLGNDGQYKYGKAVGLWRAWYETGELQGEEWFEDGKKVRGLYYDKKGRKIPEPKKN